MCSNSIRGSNAESTDRHSKISSTLVVNIIREPEDHLCVSSASCVGGRNALLTPLPRRRRVRRGGAETKLGITLLPKTETLPLRHTLHPLAKLSRENSHDSAHQGNLASPDRAQRISRRQLHHVQSGCHPGSYLNKTASLVVL